MLCRELSLHFFLHTSLGTGVSFLSRLVRSIALSLHCLAFFSVGRFLPPSSSSLHFPYHATDFGFPAFYFYFPGQQPLGQNTQRKRERKGERQKDHLLFLAFSLETSRSYTTLFINFSCTKNTCKTPYITLKIVSSRFPQVFPIFSRLSRSKFSIKTNDQCDWVACSVRDGTTFTFEDEVGLSDQRSTMRDRRKEGRKGEVGLGCCLPTLHHRRRRRLQAHTEGSAL